MVARTILLLSVLSALLESAQNTDLLLWICALVSDVRRRINLTSHISSSVLCILFVMDGLEDTVEDAADGMSSTPGTGEDWASVSFVSTITTAVVTDDAGGRPSSDASDASDGDDEEEK